MVFSESIKDRFCHKTYRTWCRVDDGIKHPLISVYGAPKRTGKEQYNISFPRSIISFPRNNISLLRNNISLPRNNLAGTEPLICHFYLLGNGLAQNTLYRVLQFSTALGYFKQRGNQLIRWKVACLNTDSPLRDRLKINNVFRYLKGLSQPKYRAGGQSPHRRRLLWYCILPVWGGWNSVLNFPWTTVMTSAKVPI